MYKRIDKERLLDILKGDVKLEESLKFENELDVIWAANDLVKDKNLAPDWRAFAGMRIVRLYKNSTNPISEDKYSQEILENKEVNAIVGIRGSLCWLLQNIIVTLETAYYSEILDLLETWSKDPNLYLRQQVTVPLEILATNMWAIKNQDGTPFHFGEKNREKTENLFFSILKENREHPRILQYLSRSIDKIRFLSDERERQLIEDFYYTPQKKQNPDQH